MTEGIQFGGVWRWVRRADSGKLVAAGRCHNSVCTAGLNDLLSVAFAAGSQHAAWYAGLIDLANFTALSPADTMASHPGWQELTPYSGARPQWQPAAPVAGVIVNPTFFSWTFTGVGTAHGFFLASDPTKGGTSGVLWATALCDADQAMNAGETLSADYTLTAAAGAGS